MKLDPFAMAEKNKDAEYFTPGSQMRLKMINGAEMQGEVVGFDYDTRFLFFKRPVVGQHERSDVGFVNMDMVAHMELKDEPSQILPEPMPYVPINRVTNRMRMHIMEFKKQRMYIGENVSPEGQQLMDSIAKTISEVKWDNDTIIVMDCVMIPPPYSVNQLRLMQGKDNPHNSTTLTHIRKMVEKHYQDERSRLVHAQNNTRRSTSPSPAPSSSSTSSA